MVFIADEVMAGFGRTGEWFAIQNFDVIPDLITFAKGVTSGYVPLGGVAINDAIYSTFADRAYPGGLTYSGHPLACAAAVATINAMEDEGMVANAKRIGEDVLGPGLRELAAKHPSVGETRGLGVFQAIELVKDRDTKESFSDAESETLLRGFLSVELYRRGLICRADDRGDPVIQLSPPLISGPQQFEEIEAVLRPVLSEASERMHVHQA